MAVAVPRGPALEGKNKPTTNAARVSPRLHKRTHRQLSRWPRRMRKQNHYREERRGFLDGWVALPAPSPDWHDGRAVKERPSRQSTSPTKKCGRGGSQKCR